MFGNRNYEAERELRLKQAELGKKRENRLKLRIVKLEALALALSRAIRAAEDDKCYSMNRGFHHMTIDDALVALEREVQPKEKRHA